MQIEERTFSAQETVLFFSQKLPISGTFYSTRKIFSTSEVLQNINNQWTDKLLLTKDFLYLKSTSPQTLPDLKTIALAELDDYATSDTPLQTAPSEQTDAKAQIILKVIIAPFLQQDGGDIEWLGFNNGTAAVRFTGKCNGCPYAQRTLKERVEKNLAKYLPEIKEAVLI